MGGLTILKFSFPLPWHHGKAVGREMLTVNGNLEQARGIGDNSRQAPRISISARLFNSLSRYAGGCAPVDLALEAGATVADVVRHFNVPVERIFLVLVNGRDVTRGTLSDPVDLTRELEEGDIVALSGPVPFSWGFGAPVV